MIDLHCHLLPGIDDGAPDIKTALAMAHMAVGDGICTVVCTPHIYPGVYENTADDIRQAVESFRAELAAADIPLQIAYAADTHAVPELLGQLQSGAAPTYNGGRYFLLEPPHHVAPPNFEDFVFRLMAAGYVPIVTHPERLSWIEQSYEVFGRLVRKGTWMQITAGSLTGRFGNTARYWAERMLDEGLVHVIATDAHDVDRRPPLLTEGRAAARRWVGDDEAMRLVMERPAAVLNNIDPASVSPISARLEDDGRSGVSILGRVARFIGWSKA